MSNFEDYDKFEYDDNKVKLAITFALGVATGCLLMFCLYNIKTGGVDTVWLKPDSTPDNQGVILQTDNIEGSLSNFDDIQVEEPKDTGISGELITREAKEITETPFEYGTELSYGEWVICLPRDFVKQDDGYWHSDEYGISVMFVPLSETDNKQSMQSKLEEIIGKDIPEYYYADDYTSFSEGYITHNAGWYNLLYDTENPNEYYIAGVDNYFGIMKISKYNPNDNGMDSIWGLQSGGIMDSICESGKKEDIISSIDYYLNDRGGGYYEEQIKELYRNHYENLPKRYTEDITFSSVINAYGSEKLLSCNLEIIAIYYYGFNRDEWKEFNDYLRIG